MNIQRSYDIQKSTAGRQAVDGRKFKSPRKKSWKSFFILMLLFAAQSIFPGNSHAQDTKLLSWNTTGLSGITADPLASSFNLTGITTTNVLTRGSGVTASSLSNGFAANGWNGTTSLTEAIAANDYFQFTINSTVGFEFSLSSIELNLRTTSTGPLNTQWVFSLDGFSTAGTAIPPIATRTGTGTQVNDYEFDLSGIAALQNVSQQVTFRLYGWDSSGGTGTAAIGNSAGDNLAVFGSISLASGNVVSIGTDNLNFTPTSFGGNTFTTLDTARFDGAPNTVSLQGDVIAAALNFTESYTLSGPGTVAAANITVAEGVSATISGELVGTDGLNKLGDGNLTLSGSNSFLGVLSLFGGELSVLANDQLGNASNNINLSGGTLRAAFAMEGRTITGAGGGIAVAAGEVFSTDSLVSTSITLEDSGEFRMLDAASILAGLTYADAGTASGSFTMQGNIVVNDNVGEATLGQAGDLVTYASADRQINVGNGATLVVEADLAKATQRIVKLGEGTLDLRGNNADVEGGFRLGTANGNTGGTIIARNEFSLGTATQIQANFGILEFQNNGEEIFFSSGLSIGGVEGKVLELRGDNVTFGGNANFFVTNGIQSRLDVYNRATLEGSFAATDQFGAVGVTVGGNGELVVKGDSFDVLVPFTVADTATLEIQSTTWTAEINVGEGATVRAVNGLVLEANLAKGGNYEAFTGEFLGLETRAALTAGDAMVVSQMSLDVNAAGFVSNDDIRFSDVLTLTSEAGVPFLLQMSYDEGLAMLAFDEGSTVGLGWNNAGIWVNAIDGNSVNQISLTNPYEGSFDDFYAAFSGVYGTEFGDLLGAYGIDEANQSIWAIIDHNSEFAAFQIDINPVVIPEPGTAGLLLSALAAGWLLRRRMRQS